VILKVCPVCGGGKFEEVKEHSESLIGICQDCGFATHDYDESKEAEILAYYKSQHRTAVAGKQKPDHRNITTTNTKLAAIANFLREFMEGKKGLIVGDIGAATGYLVSWFRKMGHKATGSEYALEYRRMAEHYYGCPLTEELTERKDYDLLVLYHVLEHMMRPDLKLKKYREMLKDDGHILISVPEYFNKFDEGVGMNVVLPGSTVQQMMDNYFHKDHINIFSRKAIRNLVQKCGFSIVKEDTEAYGTTLLCRKVGGEFGITDKDNPEEIKAKFPACRKALEHAVKDEWPEAIEAYPNFPEAHIAMLMKRYMKDPDRQVDYMDKVLTEYPEIEKSFRWLSTKALWLYQHQKYDSAIPLMEHIAMNRPGADIYMFLAWALMEVGRQKDAMAALNKCIMLNPAKWTEAISFQINAACSLPTWDEVAIERMKEEMAKQNLAMAGSITLNDPVMNG
jgi:2-polyprenyl-3-methyl-5-hydroxy-6-metoxy-1,4-benzoquinol methylase